MNARLRILAIVCASLYLLGCKPADPPQDLLKTQREALDKAKALDAQLQQQSAEKMKTIEESQK